VSSEFFIFYYSISSFFMVLRQPLNYIDFAMGNVLIAMPFYTCTLISRNKYIYFTLGRNAALSLIGSMRE